MSVHVKWYDAAHNILSYEFRDTVLWDDYVSALSQGRVMMQSVSHHVCVMNSMLSNIHLPDGFVMKVRTIIDTEPDNHGCVIFINPPLSFIQAMEKVQRIIPHFDEYCFYAETEDEALIRVREWTQAQVEQS